MPETDAARIRAVLLEAARPLSIDEICAAAFPRSAPRKRNVVRVNLHRLDVRGLLVKHPQAYAIKR